MWQVLGEYFRRLLINILSVVCFTVTRLLLNYKQNCQIHSYSNMIMVSLWVHLSWTRIHYRTQSYFCFWASAMRGAEGRVGVWQHGGFKLIQRLAQFTGKRSVQETWLLFSPYLIPKFPPLQLQWRDKKTISQYYQIRTEMYELFWNVWKEKTNYTIKIFILQHTRPIKGKITMLHYLGLP